MQPIGVFAVAVGIACFVLIAVVSLRGPRPRRRRRHDGGPMIPLAHVHQDDDHDGFDVTTN